MCCELLMGDFTERWGEVFSSHWKRGFGYASSYHEGWVGCSSGLYYCDNALICRWSRHADQSAAGAGVCWGNLLALSARFDRGWGVLSGVRLFQALRAAQPTR